MTQLEYSKKKTIIFNSKKHKLSKRKALKNDSPSLPFGLLAAWAKHRGHDAVRSIILCSGTPSLNVAAMHLDFFAPFCVTSEKLAGKEIFFLKIN